MSDNTVVVLIAVGPNGIEIPCRIFKDFDQAESSKVMQYLYKHDDSTQNCYSVKEEYCNNFNLLDPGSEAASALLKYYYPGCGEVDVFLLKEVEFDSVFVHWDLD